jgi:rubrerythrin
MKRGSRRRGKPVINSIEELLAHALALEIEAVDRYAELAEIMDGHNNQGVAALFIKMSEIEKLHVDAIRRQIRARKLNKLPGIQYKWLSAEGPETGDPADLHYLMTPNQALTLALLNEQRACDFYKDIEAATSDRETRTLAGELAEEEEEHVALLKVWLSEFPAAADDWDYDDDLPNLQA